MKNKNNYKRVCVVCITLLIISFFALGTQYVFFQSTDKKNESTQQENPLVTHQDREKSAEKKIKNKEKTKGIAEEPTEENAEIKSESREYPLREERVTESNDKIEQTLKTMTLEEKIYQMMFVTPEAITGVSSVSQAGKQTAESLRRFPVGGIIYFSQNIKSRQQVKEMIKNTQSYSTIPLFIGIDEEGGRVSRLGSAGIGTTKHPAMRTVGDSKDTSRAREIGETLGLELSDLGFNVDFAPVADVNVNSANTEIGDRSFGSDPNDVAAMVSALVEGLESQNVSSVLKHFPGHGSTTVNSHYGYSESKRNIEELRSIEFIPFKAGIDAGADFVMVSHMTLVNAIEENVPATLSKEVITGMLKSELGFNGIVITDAFNMGAIAKNYSTEDAVVKSIDAGADMILMPLNLQKAHGAVLKAVKDGRIAEERINDSVRKILKVKMG